MNKIIYTNYEQIIYTSGRDRKIKNKILLSIIMSQWLIKVQSIGLRR